MNKETAYQIKGVITNKYNSHLKGIFIRAYQLKRDKEKPIGTTTSDEEGQYTIEYKLPTPTKSDTDPGKKPAQPFIIVKAYTGNKLLGENKARQSIRKTTTINLKVDEKLRLSSKKQNRLKNLNLGLKTKADQVLLEKIFLETNGNWDKTLERWQEEKGYDEETSENLFLVKNLADLSKDYEPIISTFFQDEEITSLRDLALKYNKAELKDLVEEIGVPDETEGESDTEKAENYATEVADNLFRAVPSAVLHRMVKDDALPIDDEDTKSGLNAFFDKVPDLDLRRTSILNVINEEENLREIPLEHREPVIRQLKNLQRLAAVSPKAEAVPALMRAGLTSAYAINNIPRRTFVRLFADRVGGEAAAVSMHATAHSVTIGHEHRLMAAREALFDPAIRMINGGTSAEVRMEAMSTAARERNIPINFSTLFGSVDMCECEHCNSVYSPAAYLVELFQYLRNNNLDPTNANTGQSGIENTPLEEFFRRRPDLGHLQLTCENTNTVLPYIDLVNEVMESFVATLPIYRADTGRPRQTILGPVYNVEDETTGLLLSEPQHTNYTAYEIISREVYPVCKLPYHQPVDSLRLYFDFLKTSRYTLMNTFRRPNRPVIEVGATEEEANVARRIAGLQEQVVERALTAEYLELTQEEYIILARESFRSPEWFELNVSGWNPDNYNARIGLREVWEYYGIETEAQMLDELQWVKPAQDLEMAGFLRRTNILYTDLIELLKTHYLNPYYPRGRELEFLNDIRFSYRYLQQLMNTAAGGFRERLAPVVEILQNQFATDFRYSNAFIECWVYRHFERIGRAIVLESGSDCNCIEGTLRLRFRIHQQVLEYEFQVRANCTVVEDFFSDTTVGTRTVGSMNASDGTISFIDEIEARLARLQEELDPSEPNVEWLENSFVTTDGEIGFLHLTSRAIYLRNAPLRIECEPPDSCDISRIQLRHLDGTDLETNEYDRIHRFIRLWCKLDWTIDQLDTAIEALATMAAEGTDPGGPGTILDSFINPDIGGAGTVDFPMVYVGDDDIGDEPEEPSLVIGGGEDEDFPDGYCEPLPITGVSLSISPDFLDQIAAIKKAQELTGLELSKLLTFWTNIGTTGKKPLFERLFLKYNLTSRYPLIEDLISDDGINFDQHKAVLMDALKARAKDLEMIVEQIEPADTGRMNLADVSEIYRHLLLAKTIGVRIPELFSILHLLRDQANPFADAIEAYRFLELYQRIEESGFKVAELQYVLNDIDNEERPLRPTQGQLLKVAKDLRDALLQIDSDHPDLASDQEATEEFTREKLSLLYDEQTVEEIIQFLQGATIYNDITRRGYTKNLDSPIDATRVESDAINNEIAGWRNQFDQAPTPALERIITQVNFSQEAGIQFTGILDSDDIAEVRSLEDNIVSVDDRANYNIAINKMIAQPRQFFRDVLNPILNIAEGEIPNNLLLGPSYRVQGLGEEAILVSTAPEKFVYFLNIYLPYLREQLHQRAVVQILSSSVGLSTELTRKYIFDIILNEGGDSLYTEIIRLREQRDEEILVDENSWSGYFVPPQDGQYQFLIEANEDAVTFEFEQEDALEGDPEIDDENLHFFRSRIFSLKAGYAYQLSVTGYYTVDGNDQGLSYRFEDQKPELIPVSALFPALRTASFNESFIRLQKAAIVAKGFELSFDEVAYLQDFGSDFDDLDLNQISLLQWFRLEAYTRLRDSLPEKEFRLIDLFRWAALNQDSEVTDELIQNLSEQIHLVTNWDVANVSGLIQEEHYDLDEVSFFRNEIELLRLQIALEEANRTGFGIDQLFRWSEARSDFYRVRAIAEDVKLAIRARYEQDEWEEAIKPVHDTLREHQKQALIAYLLAQPELIDSGVVDADSLFEFFLIDVQMDACMETSRIKQAISSVQLYVQRCFLGLEEPHVGADILDRERWKWMERYRVWEANRKVFLYPENWIEPELRDVKSPFFEELESELLQGDISEENVRNALKSYLYKVDQVANLEIIGLYFEGSFERGKVHVFGRARNAPYSFFYRYCVLSELENIQDIKWYPWSRLEVDIPSYDVKNSDDLIINNGCFLTPVFWNNRLFIFFPQFLRKTIKFQTNESIEESASSNPTKLNPIEYWEIKLAWSEFRGGKWTQKNVSNESLASFIKTLSEGWSDEHGLETLITEFEVFNNLQNFFFVQVLSNEELFIEVYYEGPITSWIFTELDLRGVQGVTGDDLIFNNFSMEHFEGSLLKLENCFQFTGSSIIRSDFDSDREFQLIPNYFNRVNSNHHSLQARHVSSPDYLGQDPYFEIRTDNVDVSMGSHYNGFQIPFNHPYISSLLGSINSGELENLFLFNIPMRMDFSNNYGLNNGLTFHELNRPIAIYNWELLFHSVSLIADQLSKARRFEEARKWWHFIFNPTEVSSDISSVWNFVPFQEAVTTSGIEAILSSLSPNQPDEDINEWRENPFMPHVIARSRPTAYMKWVVMKYIDNLISWGDYLFRQFTIESVNQATQLYVLASHILGPRPESIPKRGERRPQSYMDLVNEWDAFGNALVDLELISPNSSQVSTDLGEDHFVNIYGFGTTLYFCIPNNPKLLSYWDTVADRLFKIRHCMDIEGVFRKLKLFENPIDPALLVQAAAQGLSIGSVLNDLNTPMPNYRFNYLFQRALELTSELKSLGNTLLSVLEKKDNEAISALRAQHEGSIHNLIMEVRNQQVEEAQQSLVALQASRKSPEYRLQHFQQLVGEDVEVPGIDTEFSELENQIPQTVEESGLKLIPFEKEEMDKAKLSADLQIAVGAVETLAGILHLIPGIDIDVKPIGVGAGAETGGPYLGQAGQAAARALQIGVNHTSFQSSRAGRKGGFLRQLQDRIFQANVAGYELMQIDKQITTQQIRLEIANQEVKNQQKQIDNAKEIEDFIKNKYSNQYLYQWMIDQLKTTYFQTYNLAYDFAKKAEKVYRFEKGVDKSDFIQFGYWDSARDGLLSGEKLYLSLKQLENAYVETKGYDYEITKHVSLMQVNPLALIELKESGVCEFDLPEVLFDLDYPGHYKRRIKTVAVTIPCTVGPYVSLNCTLRLLSHEYRKSKIAASESDYPKRLDDADERFIYNPIPVTAIAVSQGQNDSGVFELNFRDERYMPFEGAGAISKWRLELPNEFRQFDYNSISDVVLHLRYTSSEGGEILKSSALEYLRSYVSDNGELSRREGLFRMFSLRHEFPNEWHRYLNPIDGDIPIIELGNIIDRLPFYTKHTAISNIEMTNAYLLLRTSPNITGPLELRYANLNQNIREDDQVTSIDLDSGASIGNIQHFTAEVGVEINSERNWALILENGDNVFLTNEQLSDAWVIIKYTIEVATG